MAVKCPKCHAENPDTVKFCGECGTPLPSSEEISVSHTKTLETPKEELIRGTLFAGRYEIIEELGKGGMGKVYRVEDKKTKEELALKLIKPEISANKKTIERFSNELKLAHKISHRNVCRMFHLGEEKGTHYITMEYVPGEDLKIFIRRSGQLAVGTTIRISKQVCEGLSEAHRLGVIHRDLKPSNIMIDKDGDVRIMDFGIARLLEAKGITGAGVMIGTPEYMSPEQVEGKEVDQRSDIYSLGVILYEMVTGRVPFEGDIPFSIGVKQKSEVPRPPKEINEQIPGNLNRVILKCLEKERENRYQSAEEVRSELERIEQGLPTTDRVVPEKKTLTSKEITVQFSLRKTLLPVFITSVVILVGLLIWQPWNKKNTLPIGSDKFSIAVLPFDDESPEKDLGQFCGGIADDIITKLVKIKKWNIVDWHSAMRYQNTDRTPREISQELKATHLLYGIVRREGDNIKVTARLIDARDNRILWQQPYERKLEEIFDIQSAIAGKIAAALHIDLSPEEKSLLQKKATESIKAFEFYIQGRWYWTKRTYKDFKQSIKFFTMAVDEDPNYALAYAGIADSYVLMGFYSFQASPVYYYQKAEEAALKALEFDDSLAEAYATLAYIKMMRDWDWVGAEVDFKKAIDLNPSYATAHHWYSLLLVHQARLDEALEVCLEAWTLDPMSVAINCALADIYLCRREYDLALKLLKRTKELDPGLWNFYYSLGMAYFYKTMYEDALAAFDEYSKLIYESVFSVELFGEFIKDLLQNSDVLQQFQTILEAIGKAPVSLEEFRAALEVLMGDQDTLSAAVQEWKQLFRRETKRGFMHGVVYAKMGMEEEAQEVLEEMIELSKLKFFQLDYQIAVLSFWLGNKDLGFLYLNKAVENKAASVRGLKVDLLFDDVRSDPRFLALLKKMGLD